MKVTELRAALRKIGLSATGDKQTLEKRRIMSRQLFFLGQKHVRVAELTVG